MYTVEFLNTLPKFTKIFVAKDSSALYTITQNPLTVWWINESLPKKIFPDKGWALTQKRLESLLKYDTPVLDVNLCVDIEDLWE